MSTEIGRKAEEIAADFLKRKGFTIVARNWRTRWCEIDIVAKANENLYFVEVKYRAAITFGSGFEYITSKKLRQMRFAAEFWLAQHPIKSGEYSVAAIELAGNPPQVIDWVPHID